ncbi:hypothetical protein CFOL_v3_12272 [Cephalotus follicularis]|uniref:Uncharacterized protein n=1 Tax=Cephalotus follicularis TaxID=3775 RepID=A0A1Q3BLJ8_CEPFO|nr:hypothetical protein CFOL_v3_12272 [Cephalotus follicularis]
MEFRSFRLQRGSSLRLQRSSSSLLRSESVSAECRRITGYERLSESMRLSDELDDVSHRRKKIRAFGFLSKVFSFRKFDGDFEKKQGQGVVEEKKKKRRSSWLPDPARRWPVQGW